MNQSEVFDVIIAGGGPAGTLAAARLASLRPGCRIALIEKEPTLGGRLRATGAGAYGYGLNAISSPLFSFWDQQLKEDPEAPDLAELLPARQERFGALAGGKLSAAPVGEWMSETGARVLGGLAAKRQWAEITAILEREEGEKPVSHYWKKPRKAPAAVVLEHYAHAFGIPDCWGASPPALAARADLHQTALHRGDFSNALTALTQSQRFQEAVTVLTKCRILHGGREGDEWALETEAGPVRSRHLIVAQPPWAATTWLDRNVWPPALLNVANRAKPVSLVVLAVKIEDDGDLDLPDVVLIPAESVQVVRNASRELCFQATIDFELSLQAPAVVKAVKRIKRARRKLTNQFPQLKLVGEHVALQTVAWPASPTPGDRKLLLRMAEKGCQGEALGFCGDAYGASYDGDANLIESLVAACDGVATEHARPG